MPADSAQPISRFQNLISRFQQMIGILIWFGLGSLGFLHFVIRDRLPSLAFIYYMMPLPVITAVFLTAAAFFRYTRRRIHVLILLLLSAGLAISWIHESWYFGPHSSIQPSVRILFWNVGRIGISFPVALQRLLDESPDVIGLVEASGISFIPSDTLIGNGCKYHVSSLGRGLAIITRGEVVAETREKIMRRSWVADCSIKLDGRIITIRLVDVVSNPFIERSEVIAQISRNSGGYYPDLIMGDFNTPVDSVCFDPIRDHYSNAFETAGKGYHATWPSYFRLLAIDQIWVKSDRDIHAARIIPYTFSDHSVVIVDIAVKQESTQ